MSGRAIKLSRFQDQPARRMTLSKQIPLKARTPILRRISVGRRNASQRESNTSSTMGRTTFQRFCCTRFKMEEPSNSHPERMRLSTGRLSDKREREEPVGGALVAGK